MQSASHGFAKRYSCREAQVRKRGREGGREGWMEGGDMRAKVTIYWLLLSLSDRPTAHTALEYSWFKVRQ